MPIDIGGTACWFQDTAYERMKHHLGLNSTGDLFRLGENAGTYDDILLDHLDTDFRHVYLHPSQTEWDAWDASDKTEFLDDWGVLRRKIPSDFGGYNWERITYPLAEATEADLDAYPWPDPTDPARVVGLAERVRRLWDTTDYAISARAVSHGLFETAWELRGMERFMVDMLQNPDFAHKLIRKILNVQLGLHTALLDVVGPYVQIVVTCDDYGSQIGPLFSPRVYREFFQPYRLELNRLIRSKASRARIQHHTCGSVYKLLPDLIATNIDVLNPVQPLAAGMDSVRLKKEFGNSLAFHGAIDEQQALGGTVDDVRSEVIRRCPRPRARRRLHTCAVQQLPGRYSARECAGDDRGGARVWAVSDQVTYQAPKCLAGTEREMCDDRQPSTRLDRA